MESFSGRRRQARTGWRFDARHAARRGPGHHSAIELLKVATYEAISNIAGIGMTQFGKFPGRGLKSLAAEAIEAGAIGKSKNQ